jgi:hypothetical protein
MKPPLIEDSPNQKFDIIHNQFIEAETKAEVLRVLRQAEDIDSQINDPLHKFPTTDEVNKQLQTIEVSDDLFNKGASLERDLEVVKLVYNYTRWMGSIGPETDGVEMVSGPAEAYFLISDKIARITHSIKTNQLSPFAKTMEQIESEEDQKLELRRGIKSFSLATVLTGSLEEEISLEDEIYVISGSQDEVSSYKKTIEKMIKVIDLLTADTN